MNHPRARRLPRLPRLGVVAVTLALALGACDASDPLAPQASDIVAPQPAVVVGHVSHASTAEDLSGVSVTFEGSEMADITDDLGHFKVAGLAEDGRVRLLFHVDGRQIRVEVKIDDDDDIIGLEVRLDAEDGAARRSYSGAHIEVEGMAELVEVSGSEGSRSMTVAVAGTGGTRQIQVLEGETGFDDEGDLRTFSTLLAALTATAPVTLEADATVADDGRWVALFVKAETEDGHDDVGNDDGNHDDGNGNDDNGNDNGFPAEFEGTVTLDAVQGDAPTRHVHVTLTTLAGATRTVRIVEGQTTFDAEGDLLSVDALLSGLQRTDVRVRAEAKGPLADDGAIVADLIKVETDGTADGNENGGTDDDGNDDNGNDNGFPAEFEGTVTLDAVQGDAPTRHVQVTLTTLAGATRTVRIVEGQTTFDAEGDLLSVDALLSGLQRTDVRVRAEAKGPLADDGAIVADLIKVETDPVS